MTATHATADAMRAAFVNRNFTLVSDRLAKDATLHSPVLERSWTTRAVLDLLGPALVSIFDDLSFTDTAVHGRRAFLVFSARRDRTPVEGVQIVDVDADGQLIELAIFIRPLAALIAIAEAMRSAVDPGLLTQHGR